MPWVHFHVGNKGVVNACCVGNIPFGNINSNDFDEIWNGKSIQKLREKFMDGESDSRCKVCIQREAGGVKSIRQETFEKFPGFDVHQSKGPIYFDIRFSNICNFRCRTCWHGASSKWFKEANELGRAIGHEAILKNVEDFDVFIQKMGPYLQNAQEIYFAGGEPLVMEQHYLLLEWLIANKVKPRLRYNSNFSVMHFKQWDVLKMWEEFPEVEILASVDGEGKRGEYIRKEFIWERFSKNREALRKYPHISFKVAPTVSILNIDHLPVFYQTLINESIIQPEEFYINVLERPYYYNVKALPVARKEKITIEFNQFIEKIESQNMGEQFKAILGFMWAEDLSQHFGAFVKETQVLDRMREEKGLDFNLY